MRPDHPCIELAMEGLDSLTPTARAHVQPWRLDVVVAVLEPVLDDLADRVAALPEDGANKSRDAGRGYAQAIRDVLELMGRCE